MPELYKRAPDVPRDLYMDKYSGFDEFKIFRKEEPDGRQGWQFLDSHPLAIGHEVQQRFKKEKEIADVA